MASVQHIKIAEILIMGMHFMSDFFFFEFTIMSGWIAAILLILFFAYTHNIYNNLTSGKIKLIPLAN